MALPGDSVRAGDVVPLRVTLRPYAGPEYVETFRCASRHAGRPEVKVEVASGALVRPDVARPESLRGFIDNLQRYYTASSIVVSLSLPEDGASLRGRLIPNLPESALDTLRPGQPDAPRGRVPGRRAHRVPLLPARDGPAGADAVRTQEDTLGRNR